MHDDISRWASDRTYDGRLLSHESVAGHTLNELLPITAIQPISTILTKSTRSTITNKAEAEAEAKAKAEAKAEAEGGKEELPVLMLVDTAGCGVEEDNRSDVHGSGGSKSRSHSNEGEAILVELHVRALVARGLMPAQIGGTYV